MFEGFAKLRQSLTLLVFLRRISRELHRANELSEAKLSLEHPAWSKQWSGAGKAARSQPSSSKLAGLANPTVEEWNENYREKHPEEEEDDSREYDIT